MSASMSGRSSGGSDDSDEQLRMQTLDGDAEDGGPRKDAGQEAEPSGPRPPDDPPYEWDRDRQAWFPKVTEDFIAAYQACYGFPEDGAPGCAANVPAVGAGPAQEPPPGTCPGPGDPGGKRAGKRKAEPGWFDVDEARNTNVYVSGLPPDITVDEFIQLMSRFGLIMRDPQTGAFKVKLYRDEQGNLKGDGLCCYLRRASVDLALKLLDKDELRGCRLQVEAARFQLKGEYDASKKKKKCKDYKKKLSLQQKQLDWRPERRHEPSRMRYEQVVVIKNMFRPADFDGDPLMLNEVREDLRAECSKFGQIRKLLVFDRHPDGVASVSFRDPDEAAYCIQMLDGRWFGGRQLTAHAWDGKTDYRVEETTREREERLKGWEAFLGDPEAGVGLQPSKSACASEIAGPSTVRRFSEPTSASQMTAQEGAMKTESEEPMQERKFARAEDGRTLEDAKESGPQAEEGSPKRQGQVSAPGGQATEKGLASDVEESGLKKEAGAGGPGKEPEVAEFERGPERRRSEKLLEDGSEKESEGSGLRKEFRENRSDEELREIVLEKGSGEN